MRKLVVVAPSGLVTQLFPPDACSLDDWRPAGHFALYQRSKRLLSAFGLVRNIATEVEQPFAHIRVVERCVKRMGKLVEDCLWSCPGRQQGVPGRGLEL